MNRFDKTMTAVNLVVAVAACVLGIYLSWRGAFGKGYEVLRISGIVCSAILLTAEIFWLLAKHRGLMYDSYLRRDTEAGEVKVAVSALEDILTRTALEQPEVHDIRVRLLVEKGEKSPITAVARGSFWDVPDQLSIQEKIQNILRARFDEILNVDRPVKFHVAVERFRFARSEEKKPPTTKKKTGSELLDLSDSSFHGPRYPVKG